MQQVEDGTGATESDQIGASDQENVIRGGKNGAIDGSIRSTEITAYINEDVPIPSGELRD